MLSFLFSFACLAGLAWTLRGGRYHRHYRGRGGLNWFLHRVAASPGQESVIREAYAEVRARIEDLKGEMKAARHGVAEAFRHEALDPDELRSLLARQQASMEMTREALLEGVARIHEVLDEEQRKRVASMLGRGPRGCAGGPYRSAWGGAR